MENKGNISNQGEKKSTNDFIKLFIGIIVVIAAMVALKYLLKAMGII